jgi:hypothetical protein
VAFERGEVSSVAGSLLLGEAGETAAAALQVPPLLTTASSLPGPIKDSEEERGGRVRAGTSVSECLRLAPRARTAASTISSVGLPFGCHLSAGPVLRRRAFVSPSNSPPAEEALLGTAVGNGGAGIDRRFVAERSR